MSNIHFLRDHQLPEQSSTALKAVEPLVDAVHELSKTTADNFRNAILQLDAASSLARTLIDHVHNETIRNVLMDQLSSINCAIRDAQRRVATLLVKSR